MDNNKFSPKLLKLMLLKNNLIKNGIIYYWFQNEQITFT